MGRRWITSPMGLHHHLIAYPAFARRLPTFMVHMYICLTCTVSSVCSVHTTPTNDPWEQLTQYALSTTFPAVFPFAPSFFGQLAKLSDMPFISRKVLNIRQYICSYIMYRCFVFFLIFTAFSNNGENIVY